MELEWVQRCLSPPWTTMNNIWSSLWSTKLIVIPDGLLSASPFPGWSKSPPPRSKVGNANRRREKGINKKKMKIQNRNRRIVAWFASTKQILPYWLARQSMQIVRPTFIGPNNLWNYIHLGRYLVAVRPIYGVGTLYGPFTLGPTLY